SSASEDRRVRFFADAVSVMPSRFRAKRASNKGKSGCTMTDVIRRRTCPKCSSYRVERALRLPLRNVRVYVARLLGLRVYRCRDCGDYFYDRPLKGKAS